MPKVTVWLTSYNHAPFLAESIESILNQSFRDFELCILDDCSTDNSWNIIQDYARQDARITAIQSPENTNARFTSPLRHVEMIHGEYLAIAHCDDAWFPTKLEKQVRALDALPETGGCFTHVQFINDDGQPFSDENHYYWGIFSVANRTRFEWLRLFYFTGNHLCHPSVLLRWSVYKDLNMATPGLSGLPDFCRWIRMCCTHEIHVIEEQLTKFRLHQNETNTSSRSLASMKRDAFEQFVLLREFERLGSVNDLLQVFPEAHDYLLTSTFDQHDKRLIRYLLARIAIDYGPTSNYQLYGMNTLYELMQDADTQSFLSNTCDYSPRILDSAKTSIDVFGIIPDSLRLECSIYLDFGEGFSEENCHKQTIEVSLGGLASVSWKLDTYCDNKKPVAIRFDPDEGTFRKFYNMQATCENAPVPLQSEGSFRSSQQWDLFLTTDPKYIVDTDLNKGVLSFSFETALLTDDDVAEIKQIQTPQKQRRHFFR